MNLMRMFQQILGRGMMAAMALATAWLVAGCGSLGGDTPPVDNTPPTSLSSDTLNVGDQLTVVFSDLPTVTPPFDQRVKDDGTITLLLNQTFHAAGKTRSDLEKEIRARYVPDYFVNLTVSVKRDQFYYVDGEVKMPSRQPHPGEMTVIKAIASAQGFTDFANRNKIRLTHANGNSVIVDYDAALENPAQDLAVYPGDKIFVPRHW
jgi:protein involved in polysaccharide export with SLBB domain